MIYFNSDYLEGAHPSVMARLNETNMVQTVGYGEDQYCAAAREAGWQVFGVADPVFADRAEEMARICGPGRFPFDFTGPLPVLSACTGHSI